VGHLRAVRLDSRRYALSLVLPYKQEVPGSSPGPPIENSLQVAVFAHMMLGSRPLVGEQ